MTRPTSADLAAARDGQRARELMRSPDYWRSPDKQAEVRALFVRHVNVGRPPAPAAPAGVTAASLREKMRDPRYRDPSRRDPAFVAEIEAGWKALHHGDLPASHRGGNIRDEANG